MLSNRCWVERSRLLHVCFPCFVYGSQRGRARLAKRGSTSRFTHLIHLHHQHLLTRPTLLQTCSSLARHVFLHIICSPVRQNGMLLAPQSLLRAVLSLILLAYCTVEELPQRNLPPANSIALKAKTPVIHRMSTKSQVLRMNLWKASLVFISRSCRLQLF